MIVFFPGVQNTSLRILFGFLFALFLPGYAFIAALFPHANFSVEDSKNRNIKSDIPEETGTTDTFQNPQGINTIERVALSFGLSILIVALIGLILNFAPWGIQILPVISTISFFTVICAIIAAIRRQRLPKETRFAVSYLGWFNVLQTRFLDSSDQMDIVLDLVLIFGVLLAVSSVGYAVITAGNSSPYSEFYLLTENENEELVATGYPSEFDSTEGQVLVIGITNHEHKTVDYTVIVQLQRVETEGTEINVLERDELDRFQIRLLHNETWHHDHEIIPSMNGDDLRLTYLLYKGGVPEEPTQKNSYQNLYLWIDVEDESTIEISEPTDSVGGENNETEAEEDNNDSGIEIREPIDNNTID